MHFFNFHQPFRNWKFAFFLSMSLAFSVFTACSAEETDFANVTDFTNENDFSDGKDFVNDQDPVQTKAPVDTETPIDEKVFISAGSFAAETPTPLPEKAVKKIVVSRTKKKALEPHTDEKLDTLFAQLETQLPVDNGIWSLYICDLVNLSENSRNVDRMQAASLIKLYIMGAVYEKYEELTGAYGQETIDSNLYSMITVSDNDAANALVSYLGAGDSNYGMYLVDTFCQSHGFKDSHMGRLLLHSNEFDDNYTSVIDCGHFLKSIYLRNTDEFPYAESMFSLLGNQQRRHKIPARMPEGIHTANKTGELADVENDAGIIYDASNDLVIVFMSERVSAPGSAQETIASLSRSIYDYYNN